MDPFTSAALISGLFGLGGGILGGIGQGKATDKQLAAQKAMHEREMALRTQQLGLTSTQMDPLAQQKSRQQQAMMAAILPELRNVSVSSQVPGMNQFIPQISGGLRLPEGGFSPETLAFFSPGARASAEAQFMQAARPFVPQNTPQQIPSTLQSYGYPQLPAGPPQPPRPGGSPDPRRTPRHRAIENALNRPS